MKKFFQNALRWVSISVVAIWLLVMLIALCMGPFVDGTNSDAIVYKLEVLWIFLLPALAIIYKVNPKGMFNRLGIQRIKGLKRTAIFFACVLVLAMVGFSAIDAQHSEQYLTALQEQNAKPSEPVLENSPGDATISTPTESTNAPHSETTQPDESTQPSETEKNDDSVLDVESTEEPSSGLVEKEENVVLSRFVGKEGCSFSVSDSFDCDGVIYEIHSIKIKSDKDSESPNYNYYQIFFDLTITNERNSSVSWDLSYNGNIYGLLCHRGAERWLGGNSHIKDDGFKDMQLRECGTLTSGESLEGYCSLVCMPNYGDYPEDTWPLYTDEPFDLVLHLVVDSVDYTLTIHFNQ